MKYIRTKDGIYRNASVPTDLVIICRDRECEVNPSDIIKQADTIDELCDEFIWVTPEGEHHIKPKTGDGLWYLCCDYKKGHQIYGAIWTDKGLIYVAKMNKEGELELL